MKNYFTNPGVLNLNEAIRETVLKILAGQTGIYLNTEFGTIIISVERKTVGNYNKRVNIYTLKNAPLNDRIVRSYIQEGFDFYIVLTFGKGVNISYKYEEVLTHLVAQGLAYAFIKKVFKELKIPDVSFDRAIIPYCGDLYCDSFYMISTYEIASQYILTDISAAAIHMYKKVINNNIHLTEEIFKRRKKVVYDIMYNNNNKVFKEVDKLLSTRHCKNLNSFWARFISYIMILCDIDSAESCKIVESYEIAKNVSNETDIDMLIYWISVIKFNYINPRDIDCKHEALIPTPGGYKLMGDIKVGDQVFDGNGKPVKVIGISSERIKK